MSNYEVAFICVMLFGIIGVFTFAIPIGLISGIIIGLLVSIFIVLERILNLLNKNLKIKKEE